MSRLFKQAAFATALGLLLSAPAAAQQIIWQGGFGSSVPGGTQVRHGIAVTPNGAVPLDSNSQGLSGGAATSETMPITRALKLADGRSIVYGLVVKRLENGARFEVTLHEQESTSFLIERLKIDPARMEKGFLAKYTEPLLINDGDIIALDVLIDPRTNVKITDFFQISTGPPITREEPEKLKAEARALTLDDLSLSVTGYQVRRNGTIVYPKGGGVSARFIFLDIPEVGRVWFTVTTPPPGSGFERSAIVNEKQLVFSIGTDQYEWLSKEPILPAEGSFYVWMLFDPTFSAPALNAPPEWAKKLASGWGHVGGLDRWRKDKDEEQ